MAHSTRPLIWHQLRFALPLAEETAVGLVERLLADSSLGRVVLELRASGGQATWAVGSSAGERLAATLRELLPGCRLSRGFSRRAVDQAVVVSARPVGLPLATERLAAVVRAVLAALAATAEDEALVVQLQLGQRYAPEAVGRVAPQGWLEVLGLVPSPSLTGERGRRLRTQAGRHRAAVCLRVGVRAASPVRRRTLLQGALGALRVLESAGVRLRAREENPAKLDAVRRPWRIGLQLSAAEIVALAGWPVGALPLPLGWRIKRVSVLASRLVMRSITRCCSGRRGLVSPRRWRTWRWRIFMLVGVCSSLTRRRIWWRTSWRGFLSTGAMTWW